MARRLLHVALIGCLLGCPPSCWLTSSCAATASQGAAMGGAANAQPAGCCCRHHPVARPEHGRSHVDGHGTSHPASPSSPRDGSPRGGGPCQCICGGATFADQVSFDFADVAAPLIDLALVDGATAEVDALFRRWRPPDDDLPSGRDLCRLHSLMLC